jgi:hypothetical protein
MRCPARRCEIVYIVELCGRHGRNISLLCHPSAQLIPAAETFKGFSDHRPADRVHAAKPAIEHESPLTMVSIDGTGKPSPPSAFKRIAADDITACLGPSVVWGLTGSLEYAAIHRRMKTFNRRATAFTSTWQTRPDTTAFRRIWTANRQN